jgi:hypothetical protein
MILTDNDIPNEKLTCEACGESFECGAKSGTCWCFDLAIEPESLALLREQFQNCLCFNCLQNSSQEKNKNLRTNHT